MIEISRDNLLKPLQQVIGVVERRHPQIILSHVLCQLTTDQGVRVIATDGELEISAQHFCAVSEAFAFTVAAHKLNDIIRTLPEGEPLRLEQKKHQLVIRGERCRFQLACLPVADFPLLGAADQPIQLSCESVSLRHMLQTTQFAMADRDVRHYLNGLLLEITHQQLAMVATDGHRLAVSACPLAETPESCQAIVPKKAVKELDKLLRSAHQTATLALGDQQFSVSSGGVTLVSRLIDGRYPNYRLVIPTDYPHTVILDRLLFRQALQRVAILASEKYGGVVLKLSEWRLQLQSHNPDQEEAFEELDVHYQGEPLEIAFNVKYLTDALNAFGTESVQLSVKDKKHSGLLRAVADGSQETIGDIQLQQVIMPMQI